MQLSNFRIMLLFTGILAVLLLISNMESLLTVNKPLEQADALVVMAGSKSTRLPAAYTLYKNGVAKLILLANDGVLSAYSEQKHRNMYQVEWAELELIELGVPQKAIVKLRYTSSGTVNDALNTRQAVVDLGIKSIIIVTNDYHTRRTFWAFNRVFRGLSVAMGVHPVSSLDSTPYLTKSRIVVYEFIKLLYYIFKY